MGEVIDMFAGRKPETVTNEFWEWGQQFIEEGVLDLDGLVTDIKNCTTELELWAKIGELKAMIAEYPHEVEPALPE